MLKKIRESGVEEALKNKKGSGQSDPVFLAIENNTVDIPLQKPVSRTEFSIFFQNSFFTELEIRRTIFSKKRIEN